MNYNPQADLKCARLWLTNVNTATHFNSYVRGEISNQILKRIIVNGETGSNWIFKRFNRLQVTISSTKNNINVFASKWERFQKRLLIFQI